MKIAVIGSGISGNLVARMLHAEHDVHLLERNGYVGGHANTVDYQLGGQQGRADTGFMVFNHRTYPNFVRMLQWLGVESQASDMSFSVQCERTGWEYQGSSLNGLFAQRVNLLRPRFHRMLYDIVRFNRRATQAAAHGTLEDGRSVGEFLDACGVSQAFREYYLVPMVAAIWSARPESILDFPARFLVGFLRNHGLLQVRDRPQWRTITGGARNYVERLVQPLRDRIRLNFPVTGVTRFSDHVEIRTVQGETERFDQVVMAVHADEALAMLADASPEERTILSAFPYQTNEAVLHTDTSLLPRRRRAWASWNYHRAADRSQAVTVTYDLTRLQQLGTPVPLLLSLNRSAAIAPKRILREIRYRHPAYTGDSIQAQRRYDEISGVRRTFFCGAYWGYGFHEDGVNSALAVAKYFGKTLNSCTAASMKDESRIAAIRP
ncbi:MAG: NAD(P)/FAD-dependent oxidoreductase [Pirellulaceae bacterium]